MLRKIYLALFYREVKLELKTPSGKKSFRNIFLFTRPLKHPFFAFLLSIAAILVIQYDIFYTFLSSSIPLGHDVPFHVVSGQYYMDNIFPSFSGWLPFWFKGMPFPQFYPPLPHFIMALAGTIFGLSFFSIYKITVFATLLSLPLAVILLTRALVSKNFLVTYLVAATIIFFITEPSGYLNMGLSAADTLIVGLSSQLISFLLLAVWLYFFFKSQNSKSAELFSAIFLSAAILSSIHVIPIVIIIIASSVIVKTIEHERVNWLFDWNKIRYLILPTAFAALFSFFWYLPMVLNSNFASAISLSGGADTLTVTTMFNYWPLILINFIVFYISFRSKNLIAATISFANILIISLYFSNIEHYFRNLPLHTYRYLASFIVLTIISGAYLFDKIFNLVKNNLYKFAILLITIASMSLIWGSGGWPSNLNGNYKSYGQDRIQEVAGYLKNKNAVVNVESFDTEKENRYLVINALLTKYGIPTTFSVYWEAAAGSQFMTALRNSFSALPHSTATYSLIAWDDNFTRQDIDKHIDRAKYLGVTHFLVRSKYMIEKLRRSSEAKLEKDFGMWKLFAVRENVEQAMVVQNKVALLVADMNFKFRSTDKYDYVRFQEELLFQDMTDSVIFASTPEAVFIEDIPLLENYPAAVASDYRYRDIEKAFSALINYSRNHLLILIPSEKNTLYERLSSAALSNPNIINVSKISGEDGFNEVRDNIAYIIERLRQYLSGFDNNDNIKISLDYGSPGNLRLDFESPADEVPVLIKTNYFPAWREKNDAPIFMATPTFMLVWLSRGTDIYFGTTPGTNLGAFISILAFITFIIYYLRIFLKLN